MGEVDERVQGIARLAFALFTTLVVRALCGGGLEIEVLAAGIVGELVDFRERGEGRPQQQCQRQDREYDQANGGDTVAAAGSAHERQDNINLMRTLFHADLR